MKKALIPLSFLMLPMVAFAQTPSNLTTLISFAGDIANRLIPLLIACAVIVFFWGLIQYVWGSGGGKSKVKGRDIMIAGLLGLFVMVSFWGLIRLAQNTLGVNGATSVPIPQVPQR